MLKQTLKRAGIGFLIGIAVGNLIAFLSVLINDGGSLVSAKAMEMCGGETEAILLQSFLSGLIGFAGCGGMTFYEIESWSLLRIMASHLGVLFAVFLPVSFVLGWFGDLNDLLLLCGIMFAAYFIVWRIMCAVYQKQVRELNEIQSHTQNGRDAA